MADFTELDEASGINSVPTMKYRDKRSFTCTVLLYIITDDSVITYFSMLNCFNTFLPGVPFGVI